MKNKGARSLVFLLLMCVCVAFAAYKLSSGVNLRSSYWQSFLRDILIAAIGCGVLHWVAVIRSRPFSEGSGLAGKVSFFLAVFVTIPWLLAAAFAGALLLAMYFGWWSPV